MPLARGLFLLVLGGYALFRPGMTVSVLTGVIGLFVIADGVLAIVGGLQREALWRRWTIIRGVLEIGVGVFVFANPAVVAGVTAVTVMYVLAFTAILVGALEIVAAIQVRREIEGEGWLVLAGVLTVIFGVILLVAPISFGLLLVRVLGIFGIISGVSLIGYSFRLRRLGRQWPG
jgi:uncharacterized membrane protein HdeD (DUF308 family)